MSSLNPVVIDGVLYVKAIDADKAIARLWEKLTKSRESNAKLRKLLYSKKTIDLTYITDELDKRNNT